MRALRVVLSWLASLTLLIAAAGVAAAQEDQQAGWATPVTGQRLTLESDHTDTAYTEDAGYGQGRHLVANETWLWSDPRLPETMVSVLNFDADVSGEWAGEVIRGTLMLDGQDGSWVGTSDALALTEKNGIGLMLLTGQGEYDGLSAVVAIRTDDPECVECLQAEGFIYEGSLTPMPEPAS